MAEKLESFVFNRGSGHGSKYPWDEWTDGGVYRATRGEDFTCSMEAFRKNLYNKGIAKKLAVQTTIQGDSIVFQFSERGE